MKYHDQSGHQKMCCFFWRTHRPRTSFLAGTVLDDDELSAAMGLEKRKGDEGRGPWRKKFEYSVRNEDDGQHIEPDEF